MKHLVLVALGLASLLRCAGDEGDQVVLRSGKTLLGRVLFEGDRRILLRQGSRDVELDPDDVASVRSRRHALEGLLEEAAGARDAATFARLAERAQAAGLAGEATLFRWRMLQLDPADAAAHGALGHKKRGSGWGLPLGSRTVGWDQRLELAEDWGSAWEFSTFHYRLRSNLPLATTLDVVLDLERLLLALDRLLGHELELADVSRPMTVCLHADAASYPEAGGEAGGYRPDVDEVRIDASRGFSFATLAHELTHQWLQDAFFQRKGEGQVPAWLDEGLAEYVSASVAAWPDLRFEPGRPHPVHFRAQANAKDPYDLTRVLSFSTGDYYASTDRDLKYAQSYTLVHYLLHGGEDGLADGAPRWRAGFLDYLRLVVRGKGSSTDLKRCLGTDWRELESGWKAYVRARAS